MIWSNGSKKKSIPVLTKVFLLCESLPEVGNNLLEGANVNLKIYVPVARYSNYVTDYFWGAYADRLESAED